ncbi:MAG TPA: hypothetical protein DEA44_03905 [Firmicutes bacterium]|nr:hypothetical protein [Bacillota bacterium]HWR56305.1 hypothetical protein [Negativicutes bacterium]
MPEKNVAAQGFFEDGTGMILFLILILLILSDQNVFSRHIDSMSGGINTVRNLTDALTTTMQALKQAVEAPLAFKNR